MWKRLKKLEYSIKRERERLKQKNKKIIIMEDSPKRSNLNLEARGSSSLARHLSKSASELSCTRENLECPLTGQPRAKSAVAPISVVQKTHSFFHTLKSRWSRGRSRERRRSPGPDGGAGVEMERGDSQSTDYAADNSSEHSSSNTPRTQSPRHRAGTLGDSPLARQSDPTSTAPDSPRFKVKASVEAQGSAIPVDLLQPVDEAQRRREATLRQHSFFQLRIHLRKGQNLVAMDKNGTSDPYVKFKLGGRLLHKSRTLHRDLNPVWDECFTSPVEDPFQPVQIKVFDYDWGLQDDFMGSARLDLTTLDLGRPQELTLSLVDPSRPNRALGELHVTVTLWPKSQEDKEQYFQRNPRLSDVNKRLKSQIWSSVVTIVLVEGKGLQSLDPESPSIDPYVKFRLGNEKYKSKHSWRMRWLEQFDLHLFDDQEQILEMTVWTKNISGSRNREEFMGRTIINLGLLERECTHGLWKELEDGPGDGEIFLLLTISGTTASETISDLTAYREDPRERSILENRYIWHRVLQNPRDIGHLTVKVYGASGLASADLGGKSDPFCVLELINARLQTQTEYKTLAPSWQKIFTFNVKDITSVLEVTVYDEDRNNKVEFLGRLSIPLLRIRNGEKRWYALKDKKLRSRAKGAAPQILLEMTVVWSSLRAALRALTPKEEKLMRPEIKFKRQVFVRNVLRLKEIIMYFLEVGRIVQSCFEWESRARSLAGLLVWLAICHWFNACMIPLAGLMLFLRNWLVLWLTSGATVTTNGTTQGGSDEDDVVSEDDDDDEKDKEEKKSLKERLQAIQEVTQTVQNSIGYLASLGESVKNTFNFSVPELSWLAALLLFAATLVLYFIPIRVLLMGWGINKFARRILRPHVVPNNEVLDLLSRVPDDDDLIAFRELRLTQSPDAERRRDVRKKHKVS